MEFSSPMLLTTFLLLVLVYVYLYRYDLETPFALGWDEWDEWEAAKYREAPLAFIVQKTIPRLVGRYITQPPRNLYYYLVCRLWHRYNVLRIKTLPPTFVDRDEVLLHASFQILTDFIEKEEPWRFGKTRQQIIEAHGLDENTPANQWADIEIEIQEWSDVESLYYWWKNYRRPSRFTHQDRILENQKLWLLIRYRHFFWT